MPEDISSAKHGNDESIYEEWKSVDKLDGEPEEWGKYIVGLANRYGGKVIFGKKDNGDFDGKGIFDRFENGSKSGLDKVKEKIENFCSDKISPPIRCVMEFDEGDFGDILTITVPKRSGIPHAIVKQDKQWRKYYIKTNHGCIPIKNDKSIEWLFAFNNESKVISRSKVFININEELLPFLPSVEFKHYRIRYLDWYGMMVERIEKNKMNEIKQNYLMLAGDLYQQISVYACLYGMSWGLSEYIKDLALRKGSQLKYDQDYTAIPFSEIKMQKMDEPKIGYSLELAHMDEHIIAPIGTTIELGSSLGNNIDLIVIHNDLFSVKITFAQKVFGRGLGFENPNMYLHFTTKELSSRLEELDQKVSYLRMELILEKAFDFPEKGQAKLDDCINYVDSLSQYINTDWDFDNHIKNFPTFYKLYNIEHKIDRLYEMMSIQREK